MLQTSRFSILHHTSLNIARSYSALSAARMITTSPFTRAVVSSMRKLYPEPLADKSFDNTGLLLEAPFQRIRRNRNSVLLTIDLTRAVADEAIEQSHSVVVAYHPIIFRGLKSLTLDDSQQQSLLRLAANGISVYTPHTAVDAVPGGIADWLCDIVTGKLDDPEPEAFAAKNESLDTSSEATNTAVFKSPQSPYSTKAKDAASIHSINSNASGGYSAPSYPQPPTSLSATTHPTTIPHTRKVITSSPAAAIESANAISATPTNPSIYSSDNTGAGRLITFNEPQPLTLLITRIAHAIGSPKGFPVAIPQGSSFESLNIRTVGLCSGSGVRVVAQCQPPPDLVFMGEMTHHEALAVTERGGCVISLFHSNSERGYLTAVMRERLEKAVKAEWEKVRTEMKDSADDDDNGANGWEDGIEEMLEDDDVKVVVSQRDRDPYGMVVLQE